MIDYITTDIVNWPAYTQISSLADLALIPEDVDRIACTDSISVPTLVKRQNLVGLTLFSMCQASDLVLNALQKAKSLRYLNLFCDRLSDAGFKLICNLTWIQSLDVSGCCDITNDTDGSLAGIEALKELGALNLSWVYHVSDGALARIATLRKLELLSLQSCDRVTDDGISQLISLPKLRVLWLPGFSEISDVSLEALGTNAVALRELAICEPLDTVTDEGIRALCRSKTLEGVSLTTCRRVTAAGLVELAGVPTLKEISLFQMDCAPAAAAELKRKRPDLKIDICSGAVGAAQP